MPISGWNGDNILEPKANTNVVGLRDGKSWQWLKLWIASYHQLVQLVSPCACFSRMSTELVVLVLPHVGQELVFSDLASVTFTMEIVC